MIQPKVPIALEGWPFIAFFAFLTLVTAILGNVPGALVFLILTCFVLWFFRDPERFVPFEDDAVVSPADGKVIIIKEVEDERFTGLKAQKISIFMNVFNVHVNRIPIAGKVEKIVYKPGKFYNASSTKAELENEYCASLLTTSSGKKIAVVQISGLIARRVVCWLEPGDKLRTGERIGLIRFGSRVDIYLPLDADLKVEVGDMVRGGESLLARLS
ncbi:phosphatidylserine decarboxylase family protein [Desulforhopalus vacuolatus]|uniref:phosphatidylserine decarboxylase family protein n=1 Tax=Desulforhopalus vacuolatus TaxID=40414 RepID=UPI00196471B4|nr:phosphatidylserine decarboxylase family protein [Desulforhopalus vacuolatus]MBM9520950.1 phosphatidylserine decarboxylase family protein [Desulforhopalus vacuolatus]